VGLDARLLAGGPFPPAPASQLRATRAFQSVLRGPRNPKGSPARSVLASLRHTGFAPCARPATGGLAPAA